MPEQVAKVARFIGLETRIVLGAFLLVLALVSLLSSCSTPTNASTGRLTASNKQWAIDLTTTPTNRLESVYIEAPAGEALPSEWKTPIYGKSPDNRSWVLIRPETRY